MTVYVVSDVRWDDSKVLGVFGTPDAAQRSQMLPLGLQWGADGNGWSYSPQYGHIIMIEPFEVQDAG